MGSILQAFLEHYSKAQEHSSQKGRSYMDQTVTKISDNEIIEVFSNLQLLQNTLIYQCCGSGLFIPDSGSKFFHSGFRVKKIPDPGSEFASKNPSPFNLKKLFLNSRKYDRGNSSRIRIWTFYPSRDQKGTGSRIRNIAGYEITDMDSDIKSQENTVPLLWCDIYDCICITVSK